MSQEKRLQKYDEGIHRIQRDAGQSTEKASDEQMKAAVQAFLYYYTQPEEFTMEECLKYTRQWSEEMRPDLIPVFDDIEFRLKERFQ